jgi:hypothetical protein
VNAEGIANLRIRFRVVGDGSTFYNLDDVTVVGSAPCVVALPFTETFQSVWTVSSSLINSTCAWSCPQAGDNQWQKDSYTTGWTSGSGSYAPAGANATTHSARFHSYDAANLTVGDLITPTLDCSAAGTKTLTFWYINTSGSDKLDVYLSTNNGAAYGATLKTVTTAASWTQYSVSLPTATTATCKIKFEATSDYGVTDIGLDEINVTGSACVPPAMAPTAFAASNIAGSTMTVGWNLNGGTNVLILASAGATAPNTNPTSGTTYTASSVYGSGTALGNAFVVYDGTGTTLNMTGLALSTKYNYAIYQYTPGTMCYETASNVLSGNATTLGTCTSPLPYTQSFDVAWTIPSTLPPCTWSCPQAGNSRWQREDFTAGWSSASGSYATTGGCEDPDILVQQYRWIGCGQCLSFYQWGCCLWSQSAEGNEHRWLGAVYRCSGCIHE